MSYLGYMLMGFICISAINSTPMPLNTEIDDKVFEKRSPENSLKHLREEIAIPTRKPLEEKNKLREEKELPKYWKLVSAFNALEKELNNTKIGKGQNHLKTELKLIKQSNDIRKNKNKLNLPKEPKFSIVSNKQNIAIKSAKKEPAITKQKKHHQESNDLIEKFVIPKELIDELENQLDLPIQSNNNNDLEQDLILMGQSSSSETNFLSEDTIEELVENNSNKNNSIDVRSTVFMHKSKYKHPTIGQGFCLKKDEFQHTPSSTYGEPPENPSLHKNFLKQLLFSSENNQVSLEDPYKPSQRENSSKYLDIDKIGVIQPRTKSTSNQRDDSGKFDYDERFKLLQLFKSPLIRQKSLNKGSAESRCSDHHTESKSPASVIDPRLSLPSSYYFPIIPNEIEKMSINMPIPASTRKSILDDIQRPIVPRKENILRKYGDHDHSLYTTKSNNADFKKQPSDVYCLYYICKLKKITPSGKGNGDSVEMDCKCKNDNEIDDDDSNSKWYKNVGVIKGRMPTPMFRTKMTQRKREPLVISESFVM